MFTVRKNCKGCFNPATMNLSLDLHNENEMSTNYDAWSSTKTPEPRDNLKHRKWKTYRTDWSQGRKASSYKRPIIWRLCRDSNFLISQAFDFAKWTFRFWCAKSITSSQLLGCIMHLNGFQETNTWLKGFLHGTKQTCVWALLGPRQYAIPELWIYDVFTVKTAV